MHTLKLLLIIQILPGIADRLRKTEERIDINIDRKITDNSALRGAGAARDASVGVSVVISAISMKKDRLLEEVCQTRTRFHRFA